jgi:hypothetical protein
MYLIRKVFYFILVIEFLRQSPGQPQTAYFPGTGIIDLCHITQIQMLIFVYRLYGGSL